MSVARLAADSVPIYRLPRAEITAAIVALCIEAH